jgi:hypothetical protein
MKMKIRKANGRIIDVPDGYVLEDGDVLSIPLEMMDSMRRSTMVRDSRGVVAGSRPGFLFSDGDAAVEAAHEQYRRDLENRWRSDRFGPAKPAPAAPSSLTGDAGVAESYAVYNRDIQNRWKSRR